jgi:hypothetical protein
MAVLTRSHSKVFGWRDDRNFLKNPKVKEIVIVCDDQIGSTVHGNFKNNVLLGIPLETRI